MLLEIAERLGSLFVFRRLGGGSIAIGTKSRKNMMRRKQTRSGSEGERFVGHASLRGCLLERSPWLTLQVRVVSVTNAPQRGLP